MLTQIKNWKTGAVIFECECSHETERGRRGQAVMAAIEAGVNLKFADLSDCLFDACIFDACTFDACRFVGCAFDGCLFDACTFDACTFAGCDFARCRFACCPFDGCRFDGCTFTGCALIGCDFAGCLFARCALIGCDFDGCDFDGCTFDGCRLTGCIFDACTFDACTFDACAFDGCTFDDCIFDGCTFTRCTFTGCRFDGIAVASQAEQVAMLDGIRSFFLANPALLRMRDWHSDLAWKSVPSCRLAECGTTHCLAGCAQALSDDPVVRGMSPVVAGLALIPIAAHQFYNTNDAEVMQWLVNREYAGDAKE